MSKRYSISHHVFSRTWGVTEATSLLSLTRRSTKTPNFGRTTWYFTWPQRKKSSGVISGERGGEVISPSRPIHLLGKVLFRLSQSTTPVGRKKFLLKEKVWLKEFCLWDCNWLRHIEYVVCAACAEGLPSASLCRTLYPSLKSLPGITSWTVFHVSLFHTAAGNVFAMEWLIRRPTTTTQTLPFAWRNCYFASANCNYE
jgi:hypothetical protein